MNAPYEPSKLAALMSNEVWLRDLALMCDWAKNYKNDPTIASAFANAENFYLEILRNRRYLEMQASNIDRCAAFILAMRRISKYADTIDDSPLKNTAEALKTGILAAAPHIKYRLRDSARNGMLLKSDKDIPSRN